MRGEPYRPLALEVGDQHAATLTEDAREAVGRARVRREQAARRNPRLLLPVPQRDVVVVEAGEVVLADVERGVVARPRVHVVAMPHGDVPRRVTAPGSIDEGREVGVV